MTLGEKIVSLRKSRGMSQEQLASELGVSRQAVSRWETSAALPDAGNVLGLSRLFGVSDHLLNDEWDSGSAAAAERPCAAAGVNRRQTTAAVIMMCAGALWCLVMYVWSCFKGPDLYGGEGPVESFAVGLSRFMVFLETHHLSTLTLAFLLVFASGLGLLLKRVLGARDEDEK